jgi:hypothetical protein
MSDDESTFGPPIYAYYDKDAVEDGLLVPVSGDAGVNRVTRAVFEKYAVRIADSGATVFNIAPLMEIIRIMLNVEADRDGWRTATVDSRDLWLIPNEVDGLTLMFPDDY